MFLRGMLRNKNHWRKEGKKTENMGGSEDNSNVTVVVMHLKWFVDYCIEWACAMEWMWDGRW